MSIPKRFTANGEIAVRGFLVHLTHYDPSWKLAKKKEKPFDLAVAKKIVKELAAHQFNTLLIGVSDGVKYWSHPEFARSYSVSRELLGELSQFARSQGLQVIPKLNFSRSEINCHNHWMRAAGEEWHTHFDDDYYWKTAFEVIDEVISICKPEHFFHVGMDEDHDRSYTQFVNALKVLIKGLHKRGLRTVSWSDSSLDYASGQIYREKSELAEQQIPKDSVRLLWNYSAVPQKEMQRIRDCKLELWGAPGWTKPDQIVAFKKALLRAGGTGLVMTRWIACRKENQDELLNQIKRFAPLYTSS